MTLLSMLLILSFILLVTLLFLMCVRKLSLTLDASLRDRGKCDSGVLEKLYEARPQHAPQVSGGLLVHSMLLEDVRRWLSSEIFEIHGSDTAICDCSVPSDAREGTCSAWTLLRSDLLPTIFNSPDAHMSSPHEPENKSISSKLESTPSIGIIINPAVAWPLISSMAVIDAATVERNCGQIYYPGLDNKKTVETECTLADLGVGRSGKVVFNGPLAASDLCKKDCDVDDRYCKLQNAGGTIAFSSLGKTATGNWGCSDCSGPFPESGVHMKMQGCSQSSMPFVCKLEASSDVNPETIVDASAWAPYGKSQGYAFAAIGKSGEGMRKLFQSPEGVLSDAWTIGGSQCKFQREDWGAWIRSIKLFYETVYSAYDPATRNLSAEFDSAIGKNYLMSCPGYGYNYFENEVNLYFNPTSSDPKFQRLAEEQSNMLRRSIVGFYVIGRSCEEQLASLEGVTCSVAGATYTGSKDRCLGYYARGAKSEQDYQTFRTLEQQHHQKAVELLKKLTQKFNEVYRSDGYQKKASAFEFMGSNSSFFDLRHLDTLMKHGRIDFKDVFRPI